MRPLLHRISNRTNTHRLHRPKITLTALHIRIAGVARQTLTDRLVLSRIAQSIDAADFLQARIFATAARYIAEAILGAILIGRTSAVLRLLIAVALCGQHVTMFHRAHAAAAFVNDKTALQRANAMARLVDAEAQLGAARCTILAIVDRLPGRTDTVAVTIANVALVEAAHGFYKQRERESGATHSSQDHLKYSRILHCTAALPS